MLEDLLEAGEPVLDPLDRRRPEDLLAATAEAVDLGGQGLDPPLCRDKGLSERLASAAFADELDEIGHPSLLSRQLSLFQLQRVRQVGALLRDLLLDALEDIGHVLGLGDPFLNSLEDDPLGEGAPHERLVLACAFRGSEAAVVAAALAAHLCNRAAATAAHHAAREQVRREVFLSAPLGAGEATLPVATWPGPVHLLAAIPDRLPQRCRDNP